MKYLYIVLLLLFTSAASAQEVEVLMNDFKPMAYQEDGEIKGFDVDLWNAISEELGLTPEYRLVDTPADALAHVAQGHVSVAAGGITITEKRLKDGNKFSVAYFNSGLSILALGTKGSGFFATAKSLVAWGTLQAFLFMAAVCLISGIFFWFFERGSSAISDDPKKGIPEGSYLASAIITTIGFGDISAKKWLGRILVVFVWWIGQIPIGYMTATMSAKAGYNLENTDITGSDDLRGKRVIVEEGTATIDTLKQLGAKIVVAKNKEEALTLLLTKKAEVVVHDTPGILYFANGEGAGKTVIVGKQFNDQYYGFAILDDDLRDRVDIAIMTIKRKGTYDKIYKKWFGS